MSVLPQKTHVRPVRTCGAIESPESILATVILQKFSSCDRNVLIAIGGPGGTGKSSFSQRLRRCLPDCRIFELDHYKTPRTERKQKNLFGAHPDANDIERIRHHLSEIASDRPFDMPIYDPAHGAARETKNFVPTKFTIIDGEISTYPHFHDYIDFSVFLDAHWKTQLETRITRDIDTRGYSNEKAITTFLQSNLREFVRFGSESKKWADIHLYRHPDSMIEIESVSDTLYRNFESLFCRTFDPVTLEGLMVAVPTPFGSDSTPDAHAFITHVENLAEKGIKRIVLNGTTGEFFSTTSHERRLMCKLARRYFPGMIVVHTGCDSLQGACDDANFAQRYGADAILAIAPYYFAHAPQQGIIDYFSRLSDSLSVPLLLYKYTRHTQNDITADMLHEIAHEGIKDSDGNIELVRHTKRYFIGKDTKIEEALSCGARGIISGYANCFPSLYGAIENAWKNNDFEKIADCQKQINAISAEFSGVDLIAKVKYAIRSQCSIYPHHVRSPLRPISENSAKKIDRFMSCSSPEGMLSL